MSFLMRTTFEARGACRSIIRRKISWWNSWYLCPADPQVVKYHKDLVKKIMDDWRFDGLKLDGQHMNGVHPCYNSAHGHTRPEESVEAVPTFFKMIYDTARSIKPDSMVEFCPCGTGYSFFTMPYMNIAVASDPESSWQIRLKGKTLKALMGDSIAYFGDHVDMSDGGDDFASTVGIHWGCCGHQLHLATRLGGRRPPGSDSAEGKGLGQVDQDL